MPEEEKQALASATYEVQVFTIAKTLSIIFGFLLALAVVILLSYPPGSTTFMFLGVIFVFVVFIYVALTGPFSKDFISIEKDGLCSRQYGFISFGEVASYETDYVMKIRFKGYRLTWTLGGRGDKADEFLAFRDAFLDAIIRWKPSPLSASDQTAPLTEEDFPKETYFWGSKRAFFIGALSILMGVILFIMAIYLRAPSLGGISICAWLMGALLVYTSNPFSKR